MSVSECLAFKGLFTTVRTSVLSMGKAALIDELSAADQCLCMTAGIVASIILIVSAIVAYQRQLGHFLADLASESGHADPVAKAD